MTAFSRTIKVLQIYRNCNKTVYENYMGKGLPSIGFVGNKYKVVSFDSSIYRYERCI